MNAEKLRYRCKDVRCRRWQVGSAETPSHVSEEKKKNNSNPVRKKTE